jgi:hypothetical protein
MKGFSNEAFFIWGIYKPVYKKNASDGYRRPVLTSETTKRKKLSYMLLYNNLIEGGSMDDGQTSYHGREGETSMHTGCNAFCISGTIPPSTVR